MTRVDGVEADLEVLGDLSAAELAAVREWRRDEVRQAASPLLIHLGQQDDTHPIPDFNRGIFFRPGRYNIMDGKRQQKAFRDERDQHIRESTPIDVVCGHIFQVLGVDYDETMRAYLADMHIAYKATGSATAASTPNSVFNQAALELQDHMYNMANGQFENLIGKAQNFGNFVLGQSQLIVEQMQQAS